MQLSLHMGAAQVGLGCFWLISHRFATSRKPAAADLWQLGTCVFAIQSVHAGHPLSRKTAAVEHLFSRSAWEKENLGWHHGDIERSAQIHSLLDLHACCKRDAPRCMDVCRCRQNKGGRENFCKPLIRSAQIWYHCNQISNGAEYSISGFGQSSVTFVAEKWHAALVPNAVTQFASRD